MRVALVGFVLLPLAAVSLGGCDRDEKAPDVVESAEPPPTPKPPEQPRCEERKQSAVFAIRGQATTADDVEVGIEQPFAVEIGGATSIASGFAVGALHRQEGREHAALALVDTEARRGRIIDLGAVYGVVEPPAVSGTEDAVVLALPGNDAGSSTLRLARLDHPTIDPGDPALQWGPDFQQGRDDSGAFGLSVAGERGLLVWDDYDKGRGHSVVRGVGFRTAALDEHSGPELLSPVDEDADSPQVATRPGGFWLSYISHQKKEAPADVGQEHPPASSSTPPEPGLALHSLEPRSLRLLRLDAGGKPEGVPLTVSAEGAHVMTFDLASDEAGNAWLAYRDDPTVPGVEAPRVQLAKVGLDGAIRRQVVEDERLGVGAPRFLVANRPGQTSWLLVGGVGKETMLAALDPKTNGDLVKDLRPEKALAARFALVADGGAMLVGRPRGRDMELSSLTCRGAQALEKTPQQKSPGEAESP